MHNPSWLKTCLEKLSYLLASAGYTFMAVFSAIATSVYPTGLSAARVDTSVDAAYVISQEQSAGSVATTSGFNLADGMGFEKWAKIFDANGALRDDLDNLGLPIPNGIPDAMDLYNGRNATFVRDDISAGLNIDSTARGADELSWRAGLVPAASDIGHAYVMTTVNNDGHLILYGGLNA